MNQTAAVEPLPVALVTCAELPGGDSDDAGLVEALAAVGVAATWEIWDDPDVRWAQFPAALIRSTWDYTSKRDEFLTWAADVSSGGTTLLNPLELLQWNSDKIYLRELAEAGIPIVPTSWSAPGSEPEWLTSEFVAKPSVGAGSVGAGRFDPTTDGGLAAARTHAEMLHAAGRTVLIQPYLSDVDEVGERALLYFGGAFSHAITKGALLPPEAANPLREGSTSANRAPLYYSERISAAEPTSQELAVGERVLSWLQARDGAYPLYARVDLLPSAEGPKLIELELVEPSLFFAFGEGSSGTLANALSARLRTG
ncbi:Glutathione synthase/RimK-type ligase, ATP-grasp superfamily [Frankineae bacterium MT45]|nr:Glutathione synthase/RimK-type ligase, ATP-grasp superfamily [Frankineae bacterium MT45]